MIAGSRDASASTASHSPFAATASTRPRATSRTSSSWVDTARGVKRRWISARCDWWSGSSWSIIDVFSVWSMWGRDPWYEVYVCGCFSTCMTSSKREMPQSCCTGSQKTGALSRNQRYASHGST